MKILTHLQALPLTGAVESVCVLGIPFLATPAGQPTEQSTISLGGVVCERLFFLGMINHGWDQGQAHWSSHHSVHPSSEHELAIGDEIGRLLIRYQDGTTDTVPLVMGFTAWWYRHWWIGREKYPFATRQKTYPVSVLEPFASRPDLAAILRESLILHEDLDTETRWEDTLRHFYLLIAPRPLPIMGVDVLDNPAKTGCPGLSALTVQSGTAIPAGIPLVDTRVPLSAVAGGLSPADLDQVFWRPRIESLQRALYTSPADIPAEPSEFVPEGFKGPRLAFSGGALGRMLSNIWSANLDDIDRKFSGESGEFRESRADSPWYGGYTGIGTWAALGIYHDWVYGRSAEHIATLPLRLIDDAARRTNFVDYCDRWLYFFRANSDPDKGPPNLAQDGWDPAQYPADAPPHWTFVLNAPGGGGHHGLLNDIPGTEEMAGHGSVIVARYVAWRHHGSPTDGWLTDPRSEVYGKSRWEATRDACEFIPWLMQYTGMDVIYSEGEETGWGGHPLSADWPEPGHKKALLPPGMHAPRDAQQRRWFYANCDSYEVYPSTMCLIALRCGATMADAMGDTALAKRWRDYAERIRYGMLRKLTVGDSLHRQWRVSPFSVFPSFQDSLAPLFSAFYDQGLDPLQIDSQWVEVTRNTYHHQRSAPHGLAPVLGMGYGHGWMTKTALMLDEMDDAGDLLENLARFTYDKNMSVSPEGQDWRQYQWLIPEGVRLGPQRRWWYRIGDLTNGANQGPPMHALEMVVGVDDTKPDQPKILPRIPARLQSLSISNFPMLVADGARTQRARITYDYSRGQLFRFETDRPIPHLQIRLGPWKDAAPKVNIGWPGVSARWVVSGIDSGAPAHWLWMAFAGPVMSLACHMKTSDGYLQNMVLTCNGNTIDEAQLNEVIVPGLDRKTIT